MASIIMQRMLFSAEGLMGRVNPNILQTFVLCTASPNLFFLVTVDAVTRREDSQDPEGPN